MVSLKKHHLSKQSLLSLFLISNFPIHAWTFFIFFQHANWLVELQENSASGVLSYFLAIAFVEATSLFILLVILNRIIPLKFTETNQLSFYGLSGWSISIGMILVQFLDDSSINPLLMWGLVLFLILYMIFLIFRMLQYHKISNLTEDLLGRVQVLSTLFLFFDILAIINIFIRNIV